MPQNKRDQDPQQPDASNAFLHPLITNAVDRQQIADIAKEKQTNNIRLNLRSATSEQLSSELDEKIREKQTPPSQSSNTGSQAATPLFENQQTEDFQVTITSQVSGERVVFHAMPQIDESRNANYQSLSPTHTPTSFPLYQNTGARSLSLSGQFFARTPQEASQTIEFMNLIRSWVMPYFGTGTASDNARHISNNLGSPPDILILRALGRKNLEYVPTVLSGYQWQYPTDVDYIPSEFGEAVPRLISVSLNLLEAYSPAQSQSFSLRDYKLGRLVGDQSAFGITSSSRTEHWANASGTRRNRDTNASPLPPSTFLGE